MNLLNQTGLGNQQASSPSTAPNIPAQAATMPPPFFFPTMPFMAPYTIPPPPMPQNLDQLTIEELRTMEGNERKHVEERLKLLRNVQTMLNASAALMSQYQMVVANLPPIPVHSQPAPTAPPATVEKPEEPSSSSVESSKDQVKLEDVGREDHFENSINKVTSTSQPSTSKITTTLDSSSTATSSFIANESSSVNGESEEANEIRKRRLQKFLPID